MFYVGRPIVTAITDCQQPPDERSVTPLQVTQLRPDARFRAAPDRTFKERLEPERGSVRSLPPTSEYLFWRTCVADAGFRSAPLFFC